MKTRPYLFIIATYNDIDHQTPIIWKMVKSGLPVQVLFADRDSQMNLHEDIHIQFLQRELGLDIRYYYAAKENALRLPNRCLVNSSNPLLLKLSRLLMRTLSHFVWTDSWAKNLIKKINPQVCLADITAVNPKSIEGKFIHAARALQIPVVGLTHGPDVYCNFDWSTAKNERPIREKNIFKDERYRSYDYLVPTTSHEGRLWQTLGGHAAQRIQVLGLARYSQEWIKINNALYTPYNSKKNAQNKLKVLFFMPHWREHVHRDATLQGIEAISKLGFVHLIVKEHTREGAGNLPLEMRSRLEALPNVEVILSSSTLSIGDWIKNGFKTASHPKIESVPLIQWADVVICFATSIGIEVICQNKPLINPVYMYTFATVYDALGANIMVKSEKELLEALNTLKTEPQKMSYSTEAFQKTVVFAEKEPHDILQSYVQFIQSGVNS